MTRDLMVQVAGTKIHACFDGDPAQACIVLMNSLAADTRMWRLQVPLLLAAGYSTLRFDYRGHGGSPAAAGPYSLPMFVADMRAVIAGAGVTRPHLVGLSLGGMLVMHAALETPAAWRSATVISALADMPPPADRIWAERAVEVRRLGVQSVVAGSLERWFTPAFKAQSPAVFEEVGAMIAATDVEAYAACIEGIVKQVDLLRRLPDLRAPCHFIVGAEDLASTPARMREMAAKVPGARITEMPMAAHLPTLERPQAVFDALLSHIRSYA